MTDGQIARDVYEKFRAGDHFGDKELLIAYDYFMDVGTKLLALGDVFHLPGCEAVRVSMAFRGFAKARGIM